MDCFGDNFETELLAASESHFRPIKTCYACKKSKRKCDMEYPACSYCQTKNTTCFAYNPRTKKPAPRCLVDYLLRKVELLSETYFRIKNIRYDELEENDEEYSTDLYKFIGEPLLDCVEESLISELITWTPSRKGILFSSLFLRPNSLPAPFFGETIHSRERNRIQASPIDLRSIPKKFSEFLINNYTVYHLPQYPCISEVQLRTSYNVVFDKEREVPSLDIIVVSLAMAISSCTLLWKSEKKAIGSSNALFVTAIQQLSALKWEDSYETLTVILLFCHYSFANPVACDTWYALGIASRMSIALGLFREPDTCVDPLELDTRRRLFMITHSMERALCSLARVPFYLDNNLVTSKFPSVVADKYISSQGIEVDKTATKAAAMHFYEMRLLESEIIDVLWLAKDIFPLTLDDWVKNIGNRLEEWYAKAHEFEKLHQLQFRSINLVIQKLRLKRKSPANMNPTYQQKEETLKLIDELINMHLEHSINCNLNYVLYGVYFTIECASCLLDIIWNDTDWVVSKYSLDSIKLQYLNCTTLLLMLSKRWPAVTECYHHLKKIGGCVFHKAYGTTVIDNNSSLRQNDEQWTTEEINKLLFPYGDNPKKSELNIFGKNAENIMGLEQSNDFLFSEDIEQFDAIKVGIENNWNDEWNITNILTF
ncbi:uncharacterized protein PRCAT00005128001 [Priceomyces carsonii]|uniref:uncharacterized protein n=1 Tax=Priceomyces carsonii TaxID=28549 RepID=UPI002ED7BAC1|nr:unnamed protein product [Priceomyces carsonii]